MNKLLGILPYVYFEEPIKLGEVTLLGVPDWRGRNHVPTAASVRQSLQELSSCFPTTRGLATARGARKALTYFLLDDANDSERSLEAARKAITLMRYGLLRPDYQALYDVESTYVYLFALPPEGSGDHCIYRCWVNFNQEIWISPKHQTFPLPGWYIDFKLVHPSQLEDIEQLTERFFTQKMSDQTEDEVLLAMDWYNQSFQKYSIRNVAGHLVDIATAFETLFQLPRHQKTRAFKKAIRQWLGILSQSMDKWAEDFYQDVRSETVHSGKPASLLFTHPEAQSPHLGFLWSAQRIFRECLAAKTGLPRHIDNARLLDELTPNEVYLSALRRAGGFDDIRKAKLQKVQKLRQVYPPGKREDIIWLGKELLEAYKKGFMAKEDQRLPTLHLILQANDDDKELGLKYHQFLEEFRPICFRYFVFGWGELSEEEVSKAEPITADNFDQMRLEDAIYHFAEFAGWALLLPL